MNLFYFMYFRILALLTEIYATYVNDISSLCDFSEELISSVCSGEGLLFQWLLEGLGLLSNSQYPL